MAGLVLYLILLPMGIGLLLGIFGYIVRTEKTVTFFYFNCVYSYATMAFVCFANAVRPNWKIAVLSAVLNGSIIYLLWRNGCQIVNIYSTFEPAFMTWWHK